MALRPLGDRVAFFVGETTNNHHNEINESPDPQAAKREDLQNSSFDFADVEAVHSQDAKEKTQKKEDKPIEYEPIQTDVDRVQFAHEIKRNPPDKGYMKVDVKPAVYSIDLNIDAHWWFNHVCTVFPLLLDQGKRTHIDLKDSFKEVKRLPDFNYMFLVVGFLGLVAVVALTKFFGWW